MATEYRAEGVRHGVDVADHEEFVDWLAANPEDGMVEFRAAGTAEDVANRTTATVGEFSLGGDEMGDDREHELRFGLPADLEDAMGFVDPADRYEAIEGALAGLTACINGTVVFNAVREGVAVEGVETTVRIPTDLRVLFGIHDAERAGEMFGDLEIDVEVVGDLTDEEAARVRAYPKRSPVYNLVTRAQPSEPRVSVRAA